MSGDTSKSIVVVLSPELWFKWGDGTVRNLADFDYATTQELIEFELKVDDGFDLKIET